MKGVWRLVLGRDMPCVPEEAGASDLVETGASDSKTRGASDTLAHNDGGGGGRMQS